MNKKKAAEVLNDNINRYGVLTIDANGCVVSKVYFADKPNIAFASDGDVNGHTRLLFRIDFTPLSVAKTSTVIKEFK